jgi:hypothetical protein
MTLRPVASGALDLRRTVVVGELAGVVQSDEHLLTLRVRVQPRRGH